MLNATINGIDSPVYSASDDYKYDTLVSTILSAFVGFTLLIFFPMGIYCMYLIKKHWNEEFLRIRGRKFIIVSLSLTSIHSYIFYPCFLLYSYNDIYVINDKKYPQSGSDIDKPNQYFFLIHGVFATAMGILGITQHLYHSSKFKIASDTIDWKKHLNPNYTTWILKNWKYIKNNKLIVIAATIYYILLVSPFIIVIIFLNNITFYNTAIVYFITQIVFDISLMPLFVIVNRKLEIKTNDIWYLNDEIKRLNYLSIVNIINYIATILYIFKLNGYYTNNFLFLIIKYFIENILITVLWTILIIIPIYYNINAPYHIQLKTKIQSNAVKISNTSMRMRSRSINSIDRSISRTSISSNIDNNNAKGTIIDIFNDSVTFNLFMKHLNKEFATENGLFIIFLLQFQQFLLKYQILIDNTKNLIFKGKLSLPDCVPLSPLFANHVALIQVYNDNNASAGVTHHEIDRVEEHTDYPNSPTITISALKNEKRNKILIKNLISKDKQLCLMILNAFSHIYNKFIERDYASFEINISDYNRNNIAKIYQTLCKILILKQNSVNTDNDYHRLVKFTIQDLETYAASNQDNNDEFDILEMWIVLLRASNEIISLMRQSVQRYFQQTLK